MSGPRVFISSTFYDLKHIRSSLEQFVRDMGYEPILSEKGDIAYEPDKPLDESCYREAGNADIFVLIIGGRYGSQARNDKSTKKDSPEHFASITKREYEAAVKEDVPVYILIDRSVYTEYETFKRNRDNDKITYAHVDSTNVFLFIDEILSKKRNNPVQPFDRHTDITDWLRNQWGGLFKEMLSHRSGQQKLASLTNEVEGLAEISTTLKKYLEAVMSEIPADKAKELIKTEKERLEEAMRMQVFTNDPIISPLLEHFDASLEEIKDIFSKARTVEEIARLIEVRFPGIGNDIEKHWHFNEIIRNRINHLRNILGLGHLDFEK